MVEFMYGYAKDPTTKYFAPWFICDVDLPSWVGWQVDLSTSLDGDFEGVIVKDARGERVWRLTGNAEDRTGYLEGKWPD
jgi:hypothetical protein